MHHFSILTFEVRFATSLRELFMRGDPWFFFSSPWRIRFFGKSVYPFSVGVELGGRMV